VVDVVLSADGRRLAAAYFVPAMNRPGTDWDAWVACWDLATGRRTILPKASAPIAISPDGQWVAAGLRENARTAGGWQVGPLAPVPTLWRFGEAQPARLLESNVPPGQVVALAFSGDGKEVLGLSEDGRLLAWDTEGNAPARHIEKLALPEANDLRLTTSVGDWQPSLRATRNHVILVAPVVHTGKPSGVYGITGEWIRYDSKWTRYHLSTLSYDTRLHQGANVWGRLDVAQRPYDATLPFYVAQPYFEPKALSYPRDATRRFAFAPQTRWVAFMEPDASLAAVRKINGDWIARFPAAMVHAFTPDGNQLITSDRRGILRFWDVASGKIARTLRCDDEPADTFLVAALQAASEFGDPNGNRRMLEQLIDRAAAVGAQVVVLPEAAVTGYLTYDIKKTWRVGERPLSEGLAGVDPKDAAETIPGPSTQFFARVARRWGIYLTVPLLETDRKTGRYYNSVVLLGPEGQTLLHYRKLNPWPWAEQGWATDGDLGRPVADTPFGRFGMLICYDIHKQAAEIAKLKIDTLLYSIAWVEDEGSDWFAKRLPEIAKKSGYHIVAANWTVPAGGEKPKWFGYGQSEVVNASGKVLSKTRGDIGPDVVFAELPLPK
jgi:predicted amidohydrolase